MSNAVGEHIMQEEGAKWRAEETREGWTLPPKVEHPQLKFLVAPLDRGSMSAFPGILRPLRQGYPTLTTASDRFGLSPVSDVSMALFRSFSVLRSSVDSFLSMPADRPHGHQVFQLTPPGRPTSPPLFRFIV